MSPDRNVLGLAPEDLGLSPNSAVDHRVWHFPAPPPPRASVSLSVKWRQLAGASWHRAPPPALESAPGPRSCSAVLALSIIGFSFSPSIRLMPPREEKDRASGCRKRGPKPKRLLLQRLYSMDLRSAHQVKGKEKLCFSLARQFGGSGAPERVGRAGPAQLEEKSSSGVPTLPFPLRKQNKAQKYLRLSRKKFPPRLEGRGQLRETFLEEPAAQEATQDTSEWDEATATTPPAEQHPGKEGGDLTAGGLPWIPTHPPSEVTVTDITANSITVTFREAQAAEGFFRDRSGQF
ncbi:chromobox protein homolog 7 isoform X1 [Phascolarctos cinereus]